MSKKKKPAKPRSADRHKSGKMIRLSEEDYQTLKALAERSERTMTREASRAIRQYAASEGEKPAPGA